MEYKQPEKKIFLTFDDGPNEPYTSQILNALALHQAKATFFVCGKNVEKNPDSLRRVAKAGHALGIHSYSHNLAKTLTGNLMDEVEATRKLIFQYTNIDTKLFRPPWGITRSKLKQQLLRQDYILVHWDIMAFDWRQPAPERMANHIIKRAFPGAIVLLHDGEGIKQANRSGTAKALPVILQALSARGYEFSSLAQGYKNTGNPLKNIVVDNITWLLGK